MVKQTKNRNLDIKITWIKLRDLRETNKEEFEKLFPLVIGPIIRKEGIEQVVKEICPSCLFSLRDYLLNLIDFQIIKTVNDLKNKN